MVVWCVTKIFGVDVGKTLMNMEMLKFLKARPDTRLYPRYQLECAFHLPSCSITMVSFPNWVCHSFEFFQTIICKLPYAGIKSFNDLCIKSNSFCHLREEFYESPFLRCPVMESWQLTPRCFGTHAPYYLSMGLLPTKSNLIVCSSIPLNVFCVSTRDVSTSHSASGSCIARSSRRSILV